MMMSNLSSFSSEGNPYFQCPEFGGFPNHTNLNGHQIQLGLTINGFVNAVPALFTLWSVFYLGLIFKAEYRMMIPFAITDFVFLLPHLIRFAIWKGLAESGPFCNAFGFLMTFGTLMTALWQLIFAFWYALFIIYRGKLPPLWIEITSHLTWIVAGIYSYWCIQFYVPLAACSWCWIGNDFKAPRLAMYGTLIVCILLTTIIYLVVIIFIQIMVPYYITGKWHFIRNIAGYPILYGILWTPLTIYRVLDTLSVVPNLPLEFLLVGSIMSQMSGVFNAIYFVYSRDIITKLKRKFNQQSEDELLEVSDSSITVIYNFSQEERSLMN